MLTTNDIEQIGNVVNERLEVKLEEKLEEKLEPIKKDLKSLKKDASYLRKTTSIIAKNYDEGDAALHKRVAKIEKHVNLSQN